MRSTSYTDITKKKLRLAKLTGKQDTQYRRMKSLFKVLFSFIDTSYTGIHFFDYLINNRFASFRDYFLKIIVFLEVN